ncbi:MAG TPA: hypothetical protein VGL93_21395 [Streptosporangiaceae bacterium]|jgi:hypothetical protein
MRARSGRLAAALALAMATSLAAATPAGAHTRNYGDPLHPTFLRPTVSEPTIGERNNLIYEATVTNHGLFRATGVRVLRTTQLCPPDRPLGRLDKCTAIASSEQAMPALAPGATARFPIEVDLPSTQRTLVRTTVELSHADQFDVGHFPGGCAWYGEMWPGCAVRLTPLKG